uniref:Cystatin fetuin-B-type domain-containing protein n=1 Tax=Leptobrachium leishanense TaxID=445787 RepID=A0A8C5M8G5_9ANUR
KAFINCNYCKFCLTFFCCVSNPVVRASGGCAGCPVSLPLNDSSFGDIANRAIKKFNEKSDYNKYFTIGNITKATAQVIEGIAYNVEFSIQETTCNKSLSAVELALCQPLDCEFAHTGYCKSRSLAHWSRPNDPYVSVTCKVFEPEASAGEEEKHKDGHAAQKPDRTSGRGQSEKRENKKEKKEGDGRKRDNNHEHNHQHLHPFEHHHEQEGQGHGRQSDSVKPVGKIRYEGPEEEESKDKTGKRNPEKEKGTRGDRTPRRASNPADRQVRPVIRSFPEDVAPSDQCPGDVREYVPPPAPEDTTALPF